MADLSKIKLNGVEYDLKDAVARSQLESNLKVLEITEYIDEWISEETTIELEQSYLDLTNYDVLKLIAIGDRSSKTHYYFNEVLRVTGISGKFIDSFNNYFSYNSYQGGANDLATLVYHSADIPTLEPMANVEAMLTSFGLNASANLQSAAAGTAEVGKAVVQ